MRFFSIVVLALPLGVFGLPSNNPDNVEKRCADQAICAELDYPCDDPIWGIGMQKSCPVRCGTC